MRRHNRSIIKDQHAESGTASNRSVTQNLEITLSEEEQQMLAAITDSTAKSPVEINQEIFRFWMAKRQQRSEDDR